MAQQGFIGQALAAFHKGVKAGSGRTETVQVGPKGDRANGPYFRSLAAAGLGGLVLAAAVMPDHAQAGFSGVLPEFDQKVSMAQVDTSSPRLGLYADDWRAFTTDADFLVIDLRDDSETFGQGAKGPLLEQLKRNWTTIENVAVMLDRDKAPQLGMGHDPDRPNVCAIFLGGPQISGTVAEKAAAMGGVFDRGEDGAPRRLAEGRFATGADRIAVQMSDASFDNYISYHEMGHCADPNFRRAPKGLDGHQLSYRSHLQEAFADAFATIMTAKKEGHTETGRAFADLRMLSSTSTGSFTDLAVWGLEGEESALLENIGAKYHTTPTIDATVAWIEQVGIERVKALSPQEVVAKAQEMVEAVKLTPEAYGELKADLLDTRMDNGRMMLSPDLPASFANRLDSAMTKLAFQPGAGDAPDLAASTPVWMAKAADRDQGLVRKLASVDGVDYGRLLRSDLEEGATVLAMETKGSSVHIRMQEADGSMTRAVVGAGGDVMRYGADGKLASLSTDRPAISRADGRLEHRMIVGGEQVAVDEAEAQRHLAQRHAAAMPGR